jgi:adenylate cyclase
MKRRLRMVSGLVLFTYVVTHLINHSLGIVSIAAMEAMLEWVHPIWTSIPGTVAIYGAFVIHLTLGLFALWERRTLNLRPLEALQYLLGFSIPLLIATHVSGTRINDSLLGGDGSHYAKVLAGLWYVEPLNSVVQVALLLVAWTHVCLGLRFWLRLRPWYEIAQPFLYAAALLLPVFALLGFVAGERELSATLAQNPGLLTSTLAPQVLPGERHVLNEISWGLRAALLIALMGVLTARLIRERWQRRRGVSRITYPDGRWIDIPHGFTVLDASQLLGVPHTSICGGKGRCSTCRIHVRADPDALPPPSADELRLLQRIAAPQKVRLACQLRPRGAVNVLPLVSMQRLDRKPARRPISCECGEKEIVVLFADLFDFTKLAETRLPYDILFILNRYFQEMGRAVETTGGHVDKFIGDAVMALFGLEIAGERACIQALSAARMMFARLDELNRALAADLDAPLRMGIGIHVGPAVVGEIGYGPTRALTAIGDTVNIASRLQALSKTYGCELVVSDKMVANLELPSSQRHELVIQGRSAPLAIRTIARTCDLSASLT